MKDLALTVIPLLGIGAFTVLIASVAVSRQSAEYAPGDAGSIPQQRDRRAGGDA